MNKKTRNIDFKSIGFKSIDFNSKTVWLAVCLIFWLLSLPAKAQKSEAFILQLAPEKCVALRQGQDCYVDIKLNWSAPENGKYCIFASTQKDPLECWTDEVKGTLEMEFSSNQNTLFILKRADENLAQVELKMAWVYKSKRSSVTWRVF